MRRLILDFLRRLFSAAYTRRSEDTPKIATTELERPACELTLDLETANTQLSELTAGLDKAQTLVQTMDGTILFWNSGMERLYGWRREEAIGKKSHELLQTELPVSFGEIQRELLTRGSWDGEFTQLCRDGSMIWVTSHWALHRNADGVPVSVVNVNNDITALKRTVEALRASEATGRFLFENAGQGILTANRDGRIVDANAMAQGLFGYSRAELTSATIDMLLPVSLRTREMGRQAASTPERPPRVISEGMDLVARRKDGSEFPAETSLSFVAEHQSGLFMVFVSDVTARKQANEERERLIHGLESALAEKTVLIKEVHHRVKNNLAVIAGLLEMQASSVGDPRAEAALEESQQRVLSMALIHEYLYAADHLDRVNFGKYVQQLANELRGSYALEPDLVDLTIDAEEIELPVDRAIPCGLILNELLSNALKYAFPSGRRGKISVQFRRLESGKLSLVCGDDGTGIPEMFDWQKSKSMGLRIVKILAKQLDGELTLDRGADRTVFEVRFQEC